MKDFRRRLMALADPTRERAPLRAEIPSSDVDGHTAVIRLYDPIDSWGEFWGVSAKEFVQALDELPERIDEIHLHINSPGGDVFDGIAILNALRSHRAHVVAIVDGIAASAASFIAVGADELVMAKNSELMIHDAWGLCVGNAADMTAMAEMLGKNSDNIASIYAEKAGGDLATWRSAMEAETWYSAQEAVTAKLADRIDTAKKADDAKARYDLSIFTYAGRDNAPDPAEIAGPEGTPPDEVAETPAVPVRVNEFRHLVATTRI
jgi:ATP-dependent Clp endopeptidase proteolytic subunit ClpP